jgi:hypothetical protein
MGGAKGKEAVEWGGCVSEAGKGHISRHMKQYKDS